MPLISTNKSDLIGALCWVKFWDINKKVWPPNPYVTVCGYIHGVMEESDIRSPHKYVQIKLFQPYEGKEEIIHPMSRQDDIWGIMK